MSANAPAPLAIRVSGLRKHFRKFTVRGQYTTLKSSLIGRLFGSAQPSRESSVQVLEEVDLDVRKGQAVGIIGRNGSGKSTLLKLVAGILTPDAGTVLVDGRISPLIELGAGFHPEFSGAENIRLNGMVLGMSRGEIDERFERIVDFAGVRDFIDDPVRTYSSGMYMRLGFSIAIHADPDILLIDEILAVGDQAFARRCEQWVRGFLDAGNTILLVSHDLGAIEELCQEAVWLEGGRIVARGAAGEVIERYRATADDSAEVRAPTVVAVPRRFAEVRAGAEAEPGRRHLRSGETLLVEIDYDLPDSADGAGLTFGIRRSDGVVCYGTAGPAGQITLPERRGTLRLRLPDLRLLGGAYTIGLGLEAPDGAVLERQEGGGDFTVESAPGEIGVYRQDREPPDGGSA